MRAGVKLIAGLQYLLMRVKGTRTLCTYSNLSRSNKESTPKKRKTKSAHREHYDLPPAAAKQFNQENFRAYGRRVRKDSKINWGKLCAAENEESPRCISLEEIPNDVMRDIFIDYFENDFLPSCEVDLKEGELDGVLVEDDDDIYEDKLDCAVPSDKKVTKTSVKNEDVDLRKLCNFPLILKPGSSTDDFFNQHLPEFEQMQEVFSKHKMPSVTKILGETMPPENRYALRQWEKRMIRELGIEGFKKLKRETFANGSNFHQCVQDRLEGKPEDKLTIMEANEGHWKSIKSVLDAIPHCVDILMEETVVHPYLGYKGKFDCITRYRDTLCVIDWKTSKKPKPHLRHTYDNPLQTAAYLGALRSDKRYDLQVENAMIVVAYEDGSPADAHFMERYQCEEYWNAWLQRLHQYWASVIDTSDTRVNPK